MRETRKLEKRRFQLHQLFFSGKSTIFEEISASGRKDPKIGREYVEICVRMGRFEEASWIARELGDSEGEKRYLKQAENEPKDDPRVAEFIKRKQEGKK